MKNKTIETIELKKESKVKFEFLNDGDGVKIIFDEDVIILNGEHNQDCCEHVYADFKTLKDYLPQLKEIYKKLIIKGVPEMGIMLCFEPDYGHTEKVFIPCYNDQNGYYSSDLELVIKHNDLSKKVDISEYKEDNID